MFPVRDTIPSQHPPVMTRTLIAVNVLVFVYQISLTARGVDLLFYGFGVLPGRFSTDVVMHGHGFPTSPWLTLVTSMFLHGGFLHLLFNMWTLWVFGDNVEDKMGGFRFLLFYLSTGIAAMACHVLSNPGSLIPAVGASGAIAGVMGAYMVLFPHSMVITLIPICIFPLFVPIPAVVYLFFWFLTQFFSGTLAMVTPDHGGGIAWWAHIGGFLAGIFCFRYFLTTRRPRRRPPTGRQEYPVRW